MKLWCEDARTWQASWTCRAAILRLSFLSLYGAVGIRLAEVWQVVLLVNLSLQVQHTSLLIDRTSHLFRACAAHHAHHARRTVHSPSAIQTCDSSFAGPSKKYSTSALLVTDGACMQEG